MAQEYFNDVMDTYNQYSQWVFSGRKNEDFGDELRDDLIQRLRNFFFTGNEIDDSAVSFSNANSDLGAQVLGNEIRIDIPFTRQEGDEETLSIRGD